MTHSLAFFLSDEAATLNCGSQLARAFGHLPGIIFLYGQLGAGKTTFSRGFLRQLGHHGTVKSPTYTLVEPYSFDQFHVYHFDFYRINDPQELEYMGIRDYFTSEAICLVEWPEQAGEIIPSPDISCELQWLPQGREIKITAYSLLGNKLLKKLEENKNVT